MIAPLSEFIGVNPSRFPNPAGNRFPHTINNKNEQPTACNINHLLNPTQQTNDQTNKPTNQPTPKQPRP
ncbi:MAG: hypothetical protein WCP45_06275 [Verrucomicrobiota bacterium]